MLWGQRSPTMLDCRGIPRMKWKQVQIAQQSKRLTAWEKKKNTDKWTEVNRKVVWDMFHSSDQYCHEWFIWKYKGSAYQTVSSTKLGRKERGSEHGMQKQDPKWMKLIPTVLLALPFCDLVSWNEEPKLQAETSPTTQVLDGEGAAHMKEIQGFHLTTNRQGIYANRVIIKKPRQHYAT